MPDIYIAGIGLIAVGILAICAGILLATRFRNSNQPMLMVGVGITMFLVGVITLGQPPR